MSFCCSVSLFFSFFLHYSSFCFLDGKQIWEVEATVDKDKTQAVSSFSAVCIARMRDPKAWSTIYIIYIYSDICKYLNEKWEFAPKCYRNSRLKSTSCRFSIAAYKTCDVLFFLFVLFFAFDCSSRTCFLLRSPLIETRPSPTQLRSTSLSLMGRRSAVSLSTSCIHLCSVCGH